MPGMTVSAMALSAWLQGAQPREAKAGITGYSQTQGAWQTLGRECCCPVVSPSMGDSSGFPSRAQSWEQVWEGDRDTVEALAGPAGPLSPGCCKPETLLPASPPSPFSRARQLLLLFLRTGIVMAAPLRVIGAIK